MLKYSNRKAKILLIDAETLYKTNYQLLNFKNFFNILTNQRNLENMCEIKHRKANWFKGNSKKNKVTNNYKLFEYILLLNINIIYVC